MKLKLRMLLSTLLAGFILQTSAMAADETEYQAALTKARETLRDAESNVQLWSTSEI